MEKANHFKRGRDGWRSGVNRKQKITFLIRNLVFCSFDELSVVTVVIVGRFFFLYQVKYFLLRLEYR